jgi:hypothetical protein
MQEPARCLKHLVRLAVAYDTRQDDRADHARQRTDNLIIRLDTAARSRP